MSIILTDNMERTKYDVFINYSLKDYLTEDGIIIPNDVIYILNLTLYNI